MTGHWGEILGFAAGFCTTVSLLPQLLRIIRLRSARDVSLEMFLLFTGGVVCWLIYGVMLHSRPIVVWNAITLVLSVGILIAKLHFDRNATHEIVHPLSKEGDS